METEKIIRDFYNEDVQKEWNRIAGRPEFLLTCRFIERYIKPGDAVLDIGGGPGRYSLYLANKGCDVTLFDLSNANIEFAKERALEQGLNIKAMTGNAITVDELVDSLFDNILLMGPMYHLLNEEERIRTVNACINLLKPGGHIFISFINLTAGMIYAMKCEPSIILDQSETEFYATVLADKSYSGKAFTQAFFINQKEVLPFMEQFPLEKLHFFGQEGITAPCEGNIMSQSVEVINSWLDISEKICEREEFLSWAEHLMYVGRKANKNEDEQIENEIEYYNSLPVIFNDFIDLSELNLRDDILELVCIAKNSAVPEKKYVPSYKFEIRKDTIRVGEIDLRIGYTGSLYYGGQIGYNIDAASRGNNYAAKACRLLVPVIKAHGMSKVLITNRNTNTASKRVCEKLGAKLLRVARLPKWHDLYKQGQLLENIFEWNIE